MIEENTSPDKLDLQEASSKSSEVKEVVLTEEEASSSIEFLLAEFQEMNEQLRRQNDEGLHRLNFFIALTTSILASLVALTEFSSILPEIFQVVSIGALIFLLIIGLGMHQFMLKRGVRNDRNVRAINRIRRFFVDQNPRILPYLILPTHDEPTGWITNNRSSNRSTTQIIVALIFALLIGLVLNLTVSQWSITISAGVLGFIVGYQLLRIYANKQYKLAADEARREMRFPKNS